MPCLDKICLVREISDSEAQVLSLYGRISHQQLFKAHRLSRVELPQISLFEKAFIGDLWLNREILLIPRVQAQKGVHYMGAAGGIYASVPASGCSLLS